jgi:adenosine/AMP kinase
MQIRVMFSQVSYATCSLSDKTDVLCMMQRVGAGHTFLIVMRDAFPINFLNAVKACPEVCRIFCATSNAVQVK